MRVMCFCAPEYVSVTGQELDCGGRKRESFELNISELDAVCSSQNAGRNHDVHCTGKAGRMLGTDKKFKNKLHLTMPTDSWSKDEFVPSGLSDHGDCRFFSCCC